MAPVGRPGCYQDWSAAALRRRHDGRWRTWPSRVRQSSRTGHMHQPPDRPSRPDTGQGIRGLKDRLLAPELVETFVAEYIAEANLANRNALSRRSKLQTDLARVDRQSGRWCRPSPTPVAAVRWWKNCAHSSESRTAEGRDRRSRHARAAPHCIPTSPRSTVRRSSAWSRRCTTLWSRPRPSRRCGP